MDHIVIPSEKFYNKHIQMKLKEEGDDNASD